MTFHYSGSWGSDGNYSLTNDLEDANTVLDFILRDETYGVDKQRIYAVGHSMGGFVCGQIAARRPEIKGTVLLMPCDIGRLPQIARAVRAEGGTMLQSILYPTDHFFADYRLTVAGTVSDFLAKLASA